MSQPSLQPPAVHLRCAHNHRLVVPSFPQTFTKLTQILVFPHTCLHRPVFQTSPKPPKHPTLGYLSSILATCLSLLPQTCLILSLQISCQNSLSFLWLCTLAFIWTPRVTCVKHHVSWVCHAPSRTHTQPNKSLSIILKQLRCVLLGE
jgi:hypothetical protein